MVIKPDVAKNFQSRPQMLTRDSIYLLTLYMAGLADAQREHVYIDAYNAVQGGPAKVKPLTFCW